MSGQSSPAEDTFPTPRPQSQPRPYGPIVNTTSTLPCKRLRSCLSPTRRPSDRPSPFASRSASFSSDAGSDASWRRAKSVRWEGEDKGSAVTSYFSTYSALEYDRSPLDPPSPSERSCVLPARGARTVDHPVFGECSIASRTISADPALYDEDEEEEEEEGHDDPFPRTATTSSESSLSFVLDSPEGSVDGSEDDREWEECMERRRMMFARMQRQEDANQPEFEGYRSVSAVLAQLLRSDRADEEREMVTPLSTPCMFAADSGAGEEEHGGLEISGLRLADVGRMVLGGGSEDEEEEEGMGAKTPSLLSCSEEGAASEESWVLSSPSGSANGSGSADRMGTSIFGIKEEEEGDKTPDTPTAVKRRLSLPAAERGEEEEGYRDRRAVEEVVELKRGLLY